MHSPYFYIITLTILRLVWHVFQPIGMAGDETYYWLWGFYPDWGYYSKPPLIGWIYGVLNPLFQNNTFLFKAFTTLLGSGSLVFFYKTIQLLTKNQKLAFKCLIAYSLIPTQLLISSFLTVDSPLLFSWTGACYFFARILCKPTSSLSDFLGLFVFLSLGHLSKQMMLVQLPLIILTSLIYKPELLKTVKLWFTLIGSLLALLPSIVWNSKNGWITFQHTAHHFEKAPFGFLEFIQRLIELYGSLMVLLSPLFFVLIFKAIPKLKQIRSNKAFGFYALFGVLGFLIVSLLTIRQSINANWPASFFPGLIAFIFIAFEQSHRRLLTVGTAFAGSLSLAFALFFIFLEPLSKPLFNAGLEPQRRAWLGYPKFAQELKALAPEGEQIIGDSHRFVLSQLAYLGGFQKNVYQWNATDEIKNQFDFFGTPYKNKKTILIKEQRHPHDSNKLPENLRLACESLTYLGELRFHPLREYPKYKIFFTNNFNHTIQGQSSFHAH